MNRFFLDASALTKRFVPEAGTPLLHYLFRRVARDRLECLLIGVGEVIGVFVRKRNDGRLAVSDFSQAMTELTAEVVVPSDFGKVEADRARVLISWELIDQHSINATDALFLRVALDRADDLRQQGDDLVLVASDERLLRAARAEGLLTFNPESGSQAELHALIAHTPDETEE